MSAGDYEVFAEDELLQSLSVAAYRRIATSLLKKWDPGGPDLRLVDHRDIEIALAHDRAIANRNMDSEAALSPSEEQQ
ncbi:hypothetical protein [Phaeobacter sp. B1627]|uniref:hypothetical protein n=1 Tax=Phaeobacter sp. B1627 TaxID=2583809 RepID=UPI0011186192|nr:hypothetical protein [Phaeobacter sp. B1627]TNJ39750.1 hypothetical protein FGE21_18620 [Phaeobacter sp. B1627]